jgi:prepilin-type processing-associated H-X9-DG protein
MYFNDNKGWSPQSHYYDNNPAYSPNGQDSYWHVAAAYQMGLTGSPYNVIYWNKLLGPRIKKTPLFCPSDDSSRSARSDGMLTPNYGMNSQLGAYQNDPSLLSLYGGAFDTRKIDSIKGPGQVMMIGDALKNAYGANDVAYRISRNNLNAGVGVSTLVAKGMFRHPGTTANFAFADAHVESKLFSFVFTEFNNDNLAAGSRTSPFFDGDRKY